MSLRRGAGASLFLLLLGALVIAGCSGSGGGDPDEGSTASDVRADATAPSADAAPDVPSAPTDAREDLQDVLPPDDTLDDDVAPDVPPADVPEDTVPEVNPADAPDVPDIDETLHGLVIEGVEDAQTVRGSIRIYLRPVDVDEWADVHVSLQIDGTPVFNDSKLPTDLVLDTTRYVNGPHELEVTATAGTASESGGLSLTFDNPDYAFDQVLADEYNYQDGDIVTLSVFLGEGKTGLTVTADFSLLDNNYAAGAETVTDVGDGSYEIAYTVSAGNMVLDGNYNVPLHAVGEDGVGLAYTNLELKLRNQPPTPVDVLASIYVDEPLPPTSPDASKKPIINALNGHQYIITGGTAQISVNVSDPQGMEDVIGVIVAAQGYSGYYQTPRSLGGGVVGLTLRLDPNAGIPDRSQVTLRVAAVDRTGHVSDYNTYNLTTIQVMSGDVQVSVSWDTPVDVDLHVIEPSGEEIYYGHRTSATNGQLDLDSNPACSIDGVNNENISWLAGQSPPGCYMVLVDYWSACGSLPVAYTVTIKNCGEVSVFNSTFHGNESSGGGACGAEEAAYTGNGCVLTATFCNTCGFRAEGFIRYEDRTFNAEGFRGRTWKPMRYAIVEARRNVDGATLGVASTDRNGFYRLNFNNDGPPGFYVVVKTQTDNTDGLRDITVYNHPKFSRIYEFLTPVAYEQVGDPTRIDLDIPIVSDAGEPMAGACNIFDVALDGYDRVRRMTGADLGALRLFWQTGADTTATLYCSPELFNQAICSPEDSLQSQGLDRDRDEYDDAVILRQLYKFAESKISATDNPGEDHDGTRADPRQSWSEGMATFFSCHAQGTSVFVDTNFGGVYRVQDLETEDNPFGYGTSSGSQQGYVSEFLVSSVLWDLSDGPDDDAAIANPNGVYDAAFNYLGGEGYVGQRGFPGRDFVDFLDGWFCRGHGQAEALQTLLETREFPYDYSDPETCP